jgi:hypothetical protein
MGTSFKQAACGVFFVVSLVSCDAAGPAGAQDGPVAKVRVQVDAARNRVWLLTAQGIAIYDPAVPGRVLRVPLLGWQISEEPAGCVPQFALGPEGEAVIGSDLVPVLLRVDPETLAVTRYPLRLDHGSGVDRDTGFTALRYVPSLGGYLLVSRRDGTLWRIDRELRSATKVGVSTQAPQSDCGARVARFFSGTIARSRASAGSRSR